MSASLINPPPAGNYYQILSNQSVEKFDRLAVIQETKRPKSQTFSILGSLI
jgi:hypothetical protein